MSEQEISFSYRPPFPENDVVHGIMKRVMISSATIFEYLQNDSSRKTTVMVQDIINATVNDLKEVDQLLQIRRIDHGGGEDDQVSDMFSG